MKTKLIISTTPDAYGISTDADIAAVQNRLKHVADKMRWDWEMRDTQLSEQDEQETDGGATDRAWELCMECEHPRKTDSPKLLAAVAQAAELYPLTGAY